MPGFTSDAPSLKSRHSLCLGGSRTYVIALTAESCHDFSIFATLKSRVSKHSFSNGVSGIKASTVYSFLIPRVIPNYVAFHVVQSVLSAGDMIHKFYFGITS